MASSRGRALPVIAVMLALLLSGCAASTPAAKPLHAAGIEPPAPDPLAVYAQPADEIITITQAVDILTTECFSQLGLTYRGAQDYDQMREEFRVSDQRLYGITDLPVAELWGYMPAPGVDPTARWVDEISTDQYQLVLAGVVDNQIPTPEDQTRSPGTVNGQPVPAGGCLGKARDEVTGTINALPPTGQDLAMSLHFQAWFDAWADPRTTAAKADWITCMAAAGYTRADPVSDRLKLSNEIGIRASAADVEEARTDIDCKIRTDFIARANASHVDHARTLIAANLEELKPVAAFYDNASATAGRTINH